MSLAFDAKWDALNLSSVRAANGWNANSNSMMGCLRTVKNHSDQDAEQPQHTQTPCGDQKCFSRTYSSIIRFRWCRRILLDRRSGHALGMIGLERQKL